jgi:hypothetical protein
VRGIVPRLSTTWSESRGRLEGRSSRKKVQQNISQSLFRLTYNRYLSRLFLAIDANFRLKRRNVSSEAADPSFSNGWSYFVPESNYKAHLQQFSDLIVQKVHIALYPFVNSDLMFILF